MTTTAATKKIVQLRLSQVRLDGGTQSRVELDSATANEYAECLKNGATFPPIIVFYDGQHWWLASGFHRWHAHDKAGRKTIDCEVREGTVRDAILFSVGCNEKHGLQRTNADKRKAARMLLEDEEWATKGVNWIADKCHVSWHLVDGVLEEMQDEWEEAERKRQEREARQKKDGAKQKKTDESKKDEKGSLRAKRNQESPKQKVRQCRSRHGGTREMDITNIGKKKGIKPVYVERPGTLAYRKIEKQEVRSLPKWLRQWKRLGRDLESALQRVREVWDEIPVEE